MSVMSVAIVVVVVVAFWLLICYIFLLVTGKITVL